MKTSGNVPYSEREELTFSLGNNISWSGGGDGHGGGENAAPRKKYIKNLLAYMVVILCRTSQKSEDRTRARFRLRLGKHYLDDIGSS